MVDFSKKYDRSAYADFFKNSLLPDNYEETDEKIDFKGKLGHIDKIVKIGEVPDWKLNVYEAEHASENDPRVTLSKDIFRLMINYGVERALVIFKSRNSSNFRLSLVTVNIKFGKERGKKVVKEYSNPRRYSFFLGPDAKTHTPKQYLSDEQKVKPDSFEDLIKRFSIEVVNKDFYNSIAILFTELTGGTRYVGRKEVSAGAGMLKLPSTSDEVLKKEFSVRLIGRLVFCWFLKKKKSEKNIPLIPEELLSTSIFLKKSIVYHNILEPLFFQVLNANVNERVNEFKNAPWSQIPFLNGGLFNPHSNDFYDPDKSGMSRHLDTLKVPDEWLKKLFEVFETYNFTIDENTTVDIELSIDPEMLGRIFENLLAEINPETGDTARKSTGSYYTPRPIVEFMVEESLKQYLITKTNISEETISKLLVYENEDIQLKDIEKTKIIKALDTIKIIDPACGSGAFPMGILQKMLLVLQKIDPDSQRWLDRKLEGIDDIALKNDLKAKLKSDSFNYIHKLGIIRDAIYGVDIQPIAVEISKLRFFLSLIVDEKVNDIKENRGIKPLPNLEFKFVCANSLVGLKSREEQMSLTDEGSDILALKKIRDEYLSSYGKHKIKLEQQFKDIQNLMFKKHINLFSKDTQTMKLSVWSPFAEEPSSWFDADWMFGISDGFDVVIANPPYVNLSNLSKEDREKYKSIYSVTKNKVDLYAFFIEAGNKYLKYQGVLSYIIPHTWKATSSFSKLRELIFNNFELQFLVEMNYGTFEATVKPVVILIKKHQISSYNIKVLNDDFQIANRISSKEINKSNDFSIDTSSSNVEKSVFKSIENNTIPLGNVCKFTRGIKTSNDDKFILSIADNRDCKKVIRGRNITKYCYTWNNEYVWYRPDLMKKKTGSLPHTKELFEVPEKIILQRISKGLCGCFDSKQMYALDTCLVSDTTTLDKAFSLKYILALLNSTLLNFWYHKKFVLPTVSGYELHQVPMKNNSSIKKEIVVIVEKIIEIVERKNYLNEQINLQKLKDYNGQLDKIIYRLYELTKDEIEVVESYKNQMKMNNDE